MKYVHDQESGWALRDFASEALCEETVDALFLIWC
jgi:hypothetical protein